MADLTDTLAATIASDTGTNSAGTLTQNIWTGHSATGSTWNASNVFLAGVSNKSCIAFKQDPANTFAAHATVIGPRSLKCSAHAAPAVSATGYAYKEDGTVVSYTVANVDQVPGTQECLITSVATLTGVEVARVLPPTYRNKIHNTSAPVYGVFATQDEKLFIGYATGARMSLYGANAFSFISDAADPYYAWWQAQRGGDSNSPFFFIINGFLVLNMELFDASGGVSAGPDDGYYASQIQALMTLRSGDTLTYIDMSGFDDVANPVTYPTNPPITQPQLANLPIVSLRVGGDDYTYSSAISTLKTVFTSSANYIFYMIGGVPFTGNTTNTGQITGGAAGSSLTILGDTTNAVSVGALLQADNAGQPIIRTSVDTYRISDVASSLQQLNISGMQYGSSTSGGFLTLSSLGSQSAVTVANSFFRAISTSTLLNITQSANASFALTNTGFLVNNSIAATQVMVVVAGTGGSNCIMSHVSCHVSGSPLGFMSVALAANQIRTLTLTNMDTTSTNSSFGTFGTITLASGAATMVLNGSGIRTGVWNATAVKATGVVIIDNVTDIRQGLTSASIFANTSLGLNILTNASTLVAATTSPVAMDINGASRPQLYPWNGSAAVYAGMVNASFSISGFGVTVSGTTATATWTAFAGADHYTLALNSGAAALFTSGSTLALTRPQPNVFFLGAFDAASNQIATGMVNISSPSLSLNLALELI